ncbi:vacuolar protein sorting/targeting protein PEP1, partial [Coemansia sp. RSA 1878]
MRLARVAGTLALAVVAWARDTPIVHHTYFESSLNKLLYFKNPATLLGLDRTSGTVHRSSDYGAKWTAISDIPSGKASRLYAHPFEPKMAFVLTEDTEHWVT